MNSLKEITRKYSYFAMNISIRRAATLLLLANLLQNYFSVVAHDVRCFLASSLSLKYKRLSYITRHPVCERYRIKRVCACVDVTTDVFIRRIRYFDGIISTYLPPSATS